MENQNSVEIRSEILRVFGEVFEQQNAGTEAPEITDASILLNTGLDSLGFAILVTSLEDELGYDPFTLSVEAFYPQTFGELVNFYKDNAPA